MNTKTLTELDYYRIKETVAGLCVSTEGKNDILKREPFTDIKAFADLKLLSREWNTFLSVSRSSPLSQWPVIKPLFPVLKTEGACLDLDELYALGLFCIAQKKVRDTVLSKKDELNLKKLPVLAQSMADLSQAYNIIFAIITPDGELRDLGELREIKRKIASLKTEITSLIHQYTIDTSLSSALESSVPAFRANRQVLAVKSSQKSRIKGIVHEVSSSGQTVFVEPDDVVRKNNDLLEEENRLEQAIRKILLEATASLAECTDAFADCLPKMITMDTTLAAARWSNQNSCTYATDCEPGEPPLLLGARHPLLGNKAVPIDIRFMQGKKVLIITGPNTGGKTVTLKTFALFCLLNQTGFGIPALEGTRLPVFSDIFCDIGDSQSLDDSLSTFSGHMKNIATALNNATDNSLVLLDELGSGTDPQEGSAIAMATLDTLIEKGAFTLVTTHHGVLKNYGYTHPLCVNASVEFNSETLSPTYRLLMGVPGESHALDIASSSGIPKAVMDQARNYIATEQADISALIKGLNQKHIELDKLMQSFDEKEKDLERKTTKVYERERNIKQREHDLKKRESKEEQKFLKDSRRALENLVRELKEGEITRDKTLKVKNFISDLENAVEMHENFIEAEEKNIANEHKRAENYHEKKRAAKNQAAGIPVPATAPKMHFEPGQEVLCGKLKTRGTLIREEKKGMWSVQFGTLKMSVKEHEMILVPAQKLPSTPSFTIDLADREPDEQIITGISASEGQPGIPTTKPVFELRLLGMRVEQAIKLLERQLDLCAINNFYSFSIIHGKGTGALQQAVQDYLSSYPGIQDFHFAHPDDGGTGKTYVELRH